MIEPEHLVRFVIRPTLATLAERSGLPLATLAAERLLFATAAHESQCGRWLYQHPAGPARGIYQIEPRTYADVLRRLRESWTALYAAVIGFRSEIGDFQLEGNLTYATAVTRGLYWLVREPLPDADDIAGIGRYAKVYYNTKLGKATADDYANAYRRIAPAPSVLV